MLWQVFNIIFETTVTTFQVTQEDWNVLRPGPLRL